METKEEQSKDKTQTSGERHQDKKQMANAERRKKMRREKSGLKQSPGTPLEKPRCPPQIWRTVALVVREALPDRSTAEGHELRPGSDLHAEGSEIEYVETKHYDTYRTD
ncbi:hypothetical protein NDU88_004707 [Pleurodeles waltl]|uniref:Uncharacterized protein n=1 Tax=Pleurodeles waltl TaxID=8319 RepID=A0AAV7PEU8_PLEWA|nr:hypothetical protein NDU88_004707 [Pleurodeles waltl]